MEYKIDIQPMGSVRMTQRGKFVNKSAQRYLAYKDEIKRQISQQVRVEVLAHPVEVETVFYMPIPQSWSKKKQAAAIDQPHKSKPDIDNILKGLFDSLNGLIWKDDNLVSKVTATKVYGEHPGIKVTVKEIGELAV